MRDGPSEGQIGSIIEDNHFDRSDHSGKMQPGSAPLLTTGNNMSISKFGRREAKEIGSMLWPKFDWQDTKLLICVPTSLAKFMRRAKFCYGIQCVLTWGFWKKRVRQNKCRCVLSHVEISAALLWIFNKGPYTRKIILPCSHVLLNWHFYGVIRME